MTASSDITDLLQQLIGPAGAICLAVGLVRGAAEMEKQISDAALRHVSDLLLDKDLGNVGRLTVILVPAIFDKIFGRNALTVRFVVNSILVSTISWFILLSAKHAHWTAVWSDVTVVHPDFYGVLVPLWYVLDWISLSKGRIFVKFTSRRFAIYTLVFFFVLDTAASYILTFLFSVCIGFLTMPDATLAEVASYYFRLGPIGAYFSADASQINSWTLDYVVVPSTLLTSAWTLLGFISCILARLMIAIDGLRRFTKFWFPDADKRPLTTIAKVAAALVITGAIIIKATTFI